MALSKQHLDYFATIAEIIAAADWYRFSRWQLLRFDGYEYTYYASQNEQVSAQFWEGVDKSFTQDIETSVGIKKFWQEFGIEFAEPFHSFIDEKFPQ